MKSKLIFCILIFSLMLSGCSACSPKLEKEPVENAAQITLGSSLEVENTDDRLVLIDNNSMLAADGLYYASWGMGDKESYENSEGDMVDLYDAGLYLLLGESRDSKSAQDNRDKWLKAARSSYEILEEETISCNGQEYTLLTYNYTNEDNPYKHGISAFSVCNNSAVCVEFTYREHFKDDPKNILTVFLDHCTYITD